MVLPAPSSEPPGQKPKPPLQIAFAYVGDIGISGWSMSHEMGRQAVAREFGERVQTRYVENVPESEDDGARVLRGMANDGATLVFATTYGFVKPLTTVASEFPNVMFEHATGLATSKNVGTYAVRSYESSYLAGVLAGSVTRTNKLGLVAPMPIPEVMLNINSFALGAQSINPKVTVKVVWTGSWFNPPREAAAARSLISAGSDVLFQNTDSEAVLQTAQALGKRAIGWDSDMSRAAPKAHLASAIVNWAPLYVRTVNDVLEGKWHAESKWLGLKDGTVELASLAPDIPRSVALRVKAAGDAIRQGQLMIWTGPLETITGQAVLAEGVTASDEMLQGMNFFIKGVQPAPWQ